MKQEDLSYPRSIAFIGNYSPRLCGIATFTTDLCETIASKYQEAACFAIAVNDTANGYAYPPRVRFELIENDVASYRRAAEFLNFNDVDMVSLQHEYGIFGGVAGSHILALLRELRMPIITTLHMDSLTGARIIALFRTIVDEFGITVIIASHDPVVAEAADHVFHLLDGHLVGAVGTAVESGGQIPVSYHYP